MPTPHRLTWAADRDRETTYLVNDSSGVVAHLQPRLTPQTLEELDSNPDSIAVVSVGSAVTLAWLSRPCSPGDLLSVSSDDAQLYVRLEDVRAPSDECEDIGVVRGLTIALNRHVPGDRITAEDVRVGR